MERARNGLEALDFLQRIRENTDKDEDPAVIFLDLKMPGLNGFQVLEWIDEQQLHDRWDVIVLSGSDQAVDIQQALRMGAKAYLVKPPTVDDIRECLVPRLQRSSSGEKGSSTGTR